ncbi:PilZ domain-containing protein [Sphingomonas xanthus]|nr:PilZ domain-containing protein [Sphingomonas xanthus]
MSSRFQLHGDMIPRSVKRMFDQRNEERTEFASRTGALTLRGRTRVVNIVNLSASGAMISFAGDAHIGETVTLQHLDRVRRTGQVRWLRDGRMGISFAGPLE